MAATLEVANLPPSATFDELRAIVGAQAAVFSLDATKPALSALLVLESAQAAADAAELLHGSDWGGRTLSAARADAGQWVAALSSQVFSSGSGATPKAPAVPTVAAPPALPAGHGFPQQSAMQFHESQPRAPGFELPDWGWEQAAAAAAGTGSAGQDQGQEWQADDAGWSDAYCDDAADGTSGSGGRVEDEQWHVQERERRPRSRGSGGASVSVSDTRIMIRNLHPDSTQAAVEAAFKRFGHIVHIAKHPNRRFAHLEFAEPQSAAAALRDMHEQLVPELNSEGLILVQPSIPGREAARAATREAREQGAAAAAGGDNRVAALAGFGVSVQGSKGVSAVPTPALWVGSMGAGATAADVRAVFSRFGPLVQWTVQEAKVPGHTDPRRLKYAIVRWRTTEEAQAAHEALHKQVEPLLGPYPLKLKYRAT